VEPPSRRTEPLHAGAERLQRAVDEREERRGVRIRLEEAERLVQLEERTRATDGAALEVLEQRALPLLVLGGVARGDRSQGLDEAAAAAHLGL